MTDLPSRRLAALAVVTAVTLAPLTTPVGAATTPASATPGNTPVQTAGNVVYVTDPGLTVTDTTGGDLASGNPFTDGGSTLALPGLNLSASGTAAVTVQNRADPTALSAVAADQNRITADPNTTDPVRLGTGVAALSVTDPVYEQSAGGTDFSYSGTDVATLVFTGTALAEGTTVEALDSADTVLDSGDIDAQRTLTLTGLPTGDYAVDLEPTEAVDPTFAVSLADSQLSTTEGGTVSADATITNTGTQTGTQTVTFSVDGTQRDSATLTLEPGDSQTVTLSWDTEEGDAGTYPATVASDDDTAEATVSVLAAARFEATIDSTTAPVAPGETLDVTATIDNTGDLSDTQIVALSVDGELQDSQEVSLNGGASQQITLSWATTSADAGDHTVRVASNDPDSADAGDSTTVTVGDTDAAIFDVAIDATTSPVTEGGTLDVTASVNNTGNASDIQTVTLATNGTERDNRSVSLAASENVSVTLSWATGAGDAGNYTATVESANDTASANVTVQAPSNDTDNETAGTVAFDIEIVGTTSPILAGEQLTVSVVVENTGNATGTQTVTLATNDTERDNATVTLAPGANASLALVWTTTANDTGTYTTTVASADATATTNVSVIAPDSGPPAEGNESAAVDRYADQSGNVNTGGLVAALTDWSAGDLTTNQLLAVIEAWAESG